MSREVIYRIGETRARRFLTEFEEADVFGFCMLIDAEVIERIGGFDWVRYRDGYYEDWDFVWRAQQCGFRSAWAKGAYVHHYGAASFAERIGWQEIHRLSDRNRMLFEARKRDGGALRFAL